MKIILSVSSKIPIYEQIKIQIKRQIVQGELKADTPLPSIRMLAKELGIGIITAKRAYDDLCAEGITYSIAGKGVFVANSDDKNMLQASLGELEEMLRSAAIYAKQHGITDSQALELFKKIMEE
ncbi:MAG: GntR family transcriptional regulator [Clostridia bacterium]|nr:GntR family transcriptional regulator [Clostridia bacterium]